LLYVICGLPGTGKTIVSKRLSRMTGAVVLRTDEIRKRLYPDPRYTRDEKGKVYLAMMRTAESMLKTGASVILDATFHKKGRRNAAQRLAKRTEHGLMVIEVVCARALVEGRLARRKKGFSDAGVAVYRKIRAEWEPIKEGHLVVDTGKRGWEQELRAGLGLR